MESKNKRVPETLKRFNEASIDAKWRLVKTPVPTLALSRARACGARRIDIVLYENALRAFSYNTISIRGTALPQACDGERGRWSIRGTALPQACDGERGRWSIQTL